METTDRPPGAPPRSGLKSLLGRLLLLAAATLTALVLGELLCRYHFRKDLEALRFSESDLYYYYDSLGYRHHIPGKVGHERMWNDQGKAEMSINALGFRGREIPVRKPEGAFRILFLGDSITLGGGVPEESIFVDRVGHALAAIPAPSYEVINAGVGGVGLMEEEQLLKAAGMEVQPDLVVLCWYLNDARPPAGFPEEYVYRNPAIKWINEQEFLKRSYLVGFVYDSIRRIIVNRQLHQMDKDDLMFQWTDAFVRGKWVRDPNEFERLINLARYDFGDAWNDGSVDWMGRKIRELREFSEERGARFVVVAFPAQPQAYALFDSPFIDKPQRELAEFCKAQGIPFFDLLPLLRQRKSEPLYFDNCHFTPHGHAVVAGAILEFLRTSGSLSPTPKR
jgi:lysophospholipase L1-like esterase